MRKVTLHVALCRSNRSWREWLVSRGSLCVFKDSFIKTQHGVFVYVKVATRVMSFGDVSCPREAAARR